MDHSNDILLVTCFHRPDWFPKHFNNAQCTYRNCIFSDDSKSRTVLFCHGHLSKIIPREKNANQLWIIFDFENPRLATISYFMKCGINSSIYSIHA